MKRVLLFGLLALPIFAQIRGGGHAGGGGAMGPRGGAGGGGVPRGGFGGGNAGGGYRGGGNGGFVGANPAPPANPYSPYYTGPVPFSAAAAGGVNAGFGSVVFPSGVTGVGTVVNPTYTLNQSFATRLGATVGGQNFIGGGYNYGGRTAVYPVPVFVGGYGYNNGYQEPAQVTIINAPQPQPAIIVNPNYVPDPPARPSMQVLDGAASPTVNTITIPAPQNAEGRPLRPGDIDLETGTTANPTDEPTVYLIALKDGTIYASYAFWVEHDSLHYITPGHAHNQISLDRVDVTLSRRLNRERKLDFNVR